MLKFYLFNFAFIALSPKIFLIGKFKFVKKSCENFLLSGVFLLLKD